MRTTLDIAWLAGLLEGEGCFQAQVRNDTARPGRYLRPYIQLFMCDGDVVTRAAQLLGAKDGHLQITRKTLSGKAIYRTTISGRKAIGWMLTLYPFMGERRQERIREIVQRWKTWEVLPLSPTMCK